MIPQAFAFLLACFNSYSKVNMPALDITCSDRASLLRQSAIIRSFQILIDVLYGYVYIPTEL